MADTFSYYLQNQGQTVIEKPYIVNISIVDNC